MAFVNLQRLLALNADKGEQMAQSALQKSGATGALNNAAGSIMRGEGDAEDRVLQAEGMGRTMGAASGYTNALDSALSGQSNAMQRYQQRTGNLRKMLGDYQGAAERRAAADQNWQQSTDAANRAAAEQRQRQQAQEQARYGAAMQGYRNVTQPWNGSYNPQNAADYAAYSDAIRKGYR